MLDTLLTVCTAMETGLFAVLVGWVLWFAWLAGKSVDNTTQYSLDPQDWAWLLLLLLQPIAFCLWITDVRSMDLGQAFESMPMMLTHTHYGQAATIRFVCIGLMGRFCLPRRREGALAWVLVLTTVFAWTRSIAGHAGDSGDFDVHVLADTVHLVAIVAWSGGVVVAAWQGRLLADKSPNEFGLVIRRLSGLALFFMLVAIITGPYMAVSMIGHPIDLVLTNYGWLLDIKLGLVCMVLAAAALSRFVLLPQLIKAGVRAGATQMEVPRTWVYRNPILSISFRTPPAALLSRVLRVESVLLLATILAASALRNLNPPMVM